MLARLGSGSNIATIFVWIAGTLFTNVSLRPGHKLTASRVNIIWRENAAPATFERAQPYGIASLIALAEWRAWLRVKLSRRHFLSPVRMRAARPLASCS